MSRPFQICSLTLLAAAAVVLAEPIRPNYYAHIDGLHDKALKDALYDSINGGVRYQYGANQYHSSNNPPEWKKGDLKAYGTWQAFPLTDMTDSGTVWDMYSRSVRYYPCKAGESGCSLNIEHCFPKSWWGGDNNDAYKDLYHLNPSDARANQTGKSDYPPGVVDSVVKFTNGSLRQGFMKGHPSHRVYEPEDEYKGDFARAYFYIVTAYQDLTWANKYSAYLSGDSYLVFQPWLQEVLLRWHRQDPVSDKERNRQAVISSIQHNRNPYIDYPELVEYIWGNHQGEPVRLSSLACTAIDEPMLPERAQFDFSRYLGRNVCVDTLFSVPSASLTALRAVATVSSKVQGNGTASVTMGASSTDGSIEFDDLFIPDTAYLIVRASPFNSASSMQLDIRADNSRLLRSVTEQVTNETRHERYYIVPVPPHTTQLTIESVGGSTAKRACLQELYLLLPDRGQTSADNVPFVSPSPAARKVWQQGNLVIQTPDHGTYSIQGQSLH